MKLIFICFLVLVTVNQADAKKSVYLNAEIRTGFTISHRQPGLQDTTLAYLLSLNLDSFQQKPVDSLLNILPANFLSRKIIGIGNLKTAEALQIIYPNEVRVLIFVREFAHMNPKGFSSQWDISLYKLEKIKCIEIWQGAILKSNDCHLYD